MRTVVLRVHGYFYEVTEDYTKYRNLRSSKWRETNLRDMSDLRDGTMLNTVRFPKLYAVLRGLL